MVEDAVVNWDDEFARFEDRLQGAIEEVNKELELHPTGNYDMFIDDMKLVKSPRSGDIQVLWTFILPATDFGKEKTFDRWDNLTQSAKHFFKSTRNLGIPSPDKLTLVWCKEVFAQLKNTKVAVYLGHGKDAKTNKEYENIYINGPAKGVEEDGVDLAL
jgi:hypothetical protein